MSNNRVFVDLREKSTARNLDVLIGRTVGKLRALSRDIQVLSYHNNFRVPQGCFTGNDR